MILTRRIAVLAMVLFLASGGPASAAEALQLRWDELGPRIVGRKIEFVLSDGTQVSGKAIAAEPDGLRLNIAKSSNRQVQPKGNQLIPRGRISLLRVTEYRKRGRLIATAGAVGVAAGISAAAYPDLSEGILLVVVPAVVAGAIVGAAFGGYYIGKALDKTVTEIRILP
jgi:hypothetical protein